MKDSTLIFTILGLLGLGILLAPLLKLWLTRRAGRVPAALLSLLDQADARAAAGDEQGAFALRWQAHCEWLAAVAESDAAVVARAQAVLTRIAELLLMPMADQALDVDGARRELRDGAREVLDSAKKAGGPYRKDPDAQRRLAEMAASMMKFLNGYGFK